MDISLSALPILLFMGSPNIVASELLSSACFSPEIMGLMIFIIIGNISSPIVMTIFPKDSVSPRIAIGSL